MDFTNSVGNPSGVALIRSSACLILLMPYGVWYYLRVAGLYDVKVEGDVAGVVTLPRQIKFAAASANNKTGKFAQSEIIRELDAELILRGNWYKPKTKFGINIVNATFSDAQPEVTLYTRADWLLEEEGFHGGVKVPKPNHEHLADPEDPVTRGSIRNKFPRSQKAGVLLRNTVGRYSNLKTRQAVGATGAFIVRPKNNPNIELVFQRISTKGNVVKLSKKGVPLRGRVKGNPSQLVLKHVLVERVKVPTPRIFQTTALSTYRVWYGEYFGRDLLLAIRTAKLK